MSVDRSDRRSSSFRAALTSVSGLLAILAVHFAIGIRGILIHAPLGHDEAVYALRARYFVDATGTHSGFWAAYRAPGLPFILSFPNRVFGDSDALARFVTLALAAAVLVLVYMIGRLLADGVVGTVAAALLLATRAFTEYASVVLIDLPGVAFVLAAVAVFLVGTRHGEIRWFVVWSVPLLAAAAVYVRFGAPSSLAAGLVGASLVRAQTLWTGDRWTNCRRLVSVAVLTIASMAFVLAVPWATGSISAPLAAQQSRQRGKDIGALASYGDIGDLVWANGSRVDEVLTWPGVAVYALGLVLALFAAVVGRKPAAIFGLVSASVWMLLANVSLAQMFGQYLGLLFPFVALAAASGFVWGVRVMADRIEGSAYVIAAATVSALALFATIGAYDSVVDLHRRLLAAHVSIREAGFEIDRHYDGACGVITSYTPQIGWYSHCQGVAFGASDLSDTFPRRVNRLDESVVAERNVAIVIVERGKRQPTGDELELLEGWLLDDIANVEGRRSVRAAELDVCEVVDC